MLLGFQVKALVRDIAKLPEHLKDKVEVIQGDVTKLLDVQKTVEGQNAVVVVLGTRTDLSKHQMLIPIEKLWGRGILQGWVNKSMTF